MFRMLPLLSAILACAQAVIAPGYTDRSHKLLSVDDGTVLARMPRQASCPGWHAIDAFTRHLPNRDVRVTSQFTVLPDGSVDSVEVIRSTYPSINDAVVQYLESCTYRPAKDKDGRAAAVRVEWPLYISFVR
ncbi:MAG: energy transducer TonB [Gemmatimonadota bacterium]|nr:energy transducer TonB [Gemmatimonadota bacterium]